MDFEHVGHALCLELTNSIPDRQGADGRDWLQNADIALAWADSLGFALSAAPTDREREDLRDFRAILFAVFTAIASGEDAPRVGLDSIAAAQSHGLRSWGFRQDGMTFDRDWPALWDGGSLIAVFADSAVAELTGDRLDRVKSCPGCGWLFVDVSRNRSRRWCSMQTCGGRDKALRHYRKTAAQSEKL